MDIVTFDTGGTIIDAGSPSSIIRARKPDGATRRARSGSAVNMGENPLLSVGGAAISAGGGPVDVTGGDLIELLTGSGRLAINARGTVNVVDGYLPTSDAALEVITARAILGSFDTVECPVGSGRAIAAQIGGDSRAFR